MKRLSLVILIILALLFVLITVLKQTGDSKTVHPAMTADSVQQQDSVSTFWKYYRQATTDRHEGRMKDALLNYRKALKLNPRHENTLYYMGNAAMLTNDFSLADSCWSELVKVNPESARAYNQLGGLYFCPAAGAFWNPEKSRRYYLKASALNQESPGTQNRLGEIALVQGKERKARDLFSQIIVSSPNSIQAQFLLSYLEWKHRRISSARTHFIVTLHSLPPAVLSKKDNGLSHRDNCAFLENRIYTLIPESAGPDTTKWMNRVFTAFSIQPGKITKTSTR